MRRVFADAFYFFAIINEKEAPHQLAIQFADTYRGELWTTPWVLTEIGDGLAARSQRILFIELWDDLARNPHVHMPLCSNELLSAGLSLYRARLDKDWSLTDCISFVVMEREGIREALTGDRHFEQAGFVPLLK
jgi:predicted nucleic acid-binding protein